jgi:hypothetical protein
LPIAVNMPIDAVIRSGGRVNMRQVNGGHGVVAAAHHARSDQKRKAIVAEEQGARLIRN